MKILEGENLEISDKIKEVLDYLKGKYKLAIASNSEKDFVLKIVKKMGMEKYFDWIFTRNDVKKPKPYPEIYKLALKKMEINPEEAIAFEDSETGINSAKSSGIFCVGVLTTQVIEKLKNADIIINEINLKNIKKIIKIFEQK
ncbi:MAG: HAD family hydrolase [Candidatus Ratteibacteria bacterium]